MSEYSRKISYIYEYKDGQKSDNKGFIKTEIRKNQGCMNIELRELGKNEMAPVTIGYYLWQNGRVKACGYNKKNISEKNASLRVEFNPEDMEGAEIGEIGGVIIWNDGKMYSAEWSEEGFDPEKIDWVDSFKKVMVSQGELKKEETPIIYKKEKTVKIAPQTLLKNDEDTLQTASIDETQEDLPVQEIPDFLKVKKKDKRNRIKYEKSYHMKVNNWKDFFKKYDVVEPFSDELIYNCVEIKYDDLKYLPSSCNNVRNNSFLLHGLYNYDHVLVGKYKCKRRQQIFVLGVPGRYDNNQKMIASMFGFDNFKAGQRGSVRDKSFGYWYTLFRDDE